VKNGWQKVLQNNFRDWSQLADFLHLDAKARSHILKNPSFPLNLPQRLAEKMEKNSLEDPLLKQFLPTKQEEILSPSFVKNPLQEDSFQKTKRLLHKYRSRALLITTNLCAMHCRFCFRKFFPYEKEKTLFTKEIEAIQKQPDIFEVILSGGDPLSLSDRVLFSLLEQLDSLEQIKVVRIHSRFLMGIPERIDASFLERLSKISCNVVFVIHANHPKEIDEDVQRALLLLHKQGAMLFNQSVLLKGVNDRQEILEELSIKLTESKVVPYYLHQLDAVSGTEHFFVEEERGKALIEGLRKTLPGYCVPKYVKEIPFQPYKSLIA